MRLLITGSESFVGRQLLEGCQAAGVEAVGVDVTPPTRPNCLRADIRAKDLSAVIPEGVDAVIHLAALSRDADCAADPARCFDVNVMGTLNVIDAARTRGARQFVFASSEWVYDGVADDLAKDEDACIDITRLRSEYALSKLVGEAILRQQYARGFCPTTILRFGIIYGPRPTNWSAVESILHAVKVADDVRVGSLATARRFVHVRDIVDGIQRTVGLGGFQVINLAGSRLVTLREIIEAGMWLLDRRPRVVVTDPERPSVRDVANEKAKQLLGWEPRVGLEEGLRSVLPVI